MTAFHEKIEICLETWEDFVLAAKEIHDESKCEIPLCEIGTFVKKVFSHVYSRRASPHFLKKIFIKECEMSPGAFNSIFLA